MPKKSTKRKTTTTSRSKRKPKNAYQKFIAKLKRFERKHIVATAVIAIVIGAGISMFLSANSYDVAAAQMYTITCKDNKTGKAIAPDKKVYSAYRIDGYFMFPTANGCANRSQVERAHKIGAKTIVTFGSTLKEGSLSTDDDFKDVRIGGKNIYDHAKSVSSAKINRVFTYKDKQTFSKNALSCGSKRNGVHTVGDAVYTWWLFPVDGAYSACSSRSNTYDLVVARSSSKIDANLMMVSNAATYGMKVYLGLPKPQVDPKITYRADSSYHHTLGAFATRMLATWNERFGSSNAFAGVYQTLETPVFSNESIWSTNLKVYSVLNQVTTYQLSKSKERVLISPYANLKTSQPLKAVGPAYRKIVQTGNGATIILAPQDGVGTGGVGLSLVDSFYSEARRGSGAHEFWANVEIFKPGGAVGKRPPTDKATLDKQVQKGWSSASNVIGYRWDYMEKTGIPRQLLGKNY